ncbi:ATP-binding protein [Mycobacterium vicinigordonae]|nr:ATP-binding protein [Mycobacterium vicinigordonae]
MSRVGAADATTVGELRRDLQRWLQDVVDDTAELGDIVLSVNEALANCVEHAYRAHQRAGQMRMRARYDRVLRHLHICVSDRGTWRKPVTRPCSDAGASRGITLMHAVADRCTIKVRPDGTTVCMEYAPRPGTETLDW